MRFIIDMNLSPQWEKILQSADIEAVHWSNIGSFNAPDTDIFNYARSNDYAIISCDIDFTAILALTNADSPSVILIRAKNILPVSFSEILITSIRENHTVINNGAILVIDEDKMRIRILPIGDEGN